MARAPVTATIPAGQSLSNSIDCRNGMPVVIYMPADFTPAQLSLLISYDGQIYHDLFDRIAKEVTFNIEPNTAVRIDSEWTNSALGGYLKLRSGSCKRPIVQEADRTFTVILDN